MKDPYFSRPSSRFGKVFLILFAAVLASWQCPAIVITGNIVGQADFVTYTITDGTHSADFLWSEAGPGTSGYVYGTGSTSVAVATGVTNVTQISNAASYTYTSSFVGPLQDAAANGGIGQFAVLKTTAGYYAVVRFDDVLNNDTLNATWWFQTNGTGDFSSFVPAVPTLPVALNATNLVWTTNGNLPWFAEVAVTHDGTAAAQSGHITDSQVSDIRTTAPTNGQISFYWKVSSEQDADFLTFYINGVFKDSISGEVDWTQDTFSVHTGDALTWEYSKDDGGSQGSDAGWLDQVNFSPSVPIGPVTAVLDLVLERSSNVVDNSVGFEAIAELTHIDPAPVTQHQVRSFDGLIHGEVDAGQTSWSTSQSPIYATLDQLIFAITNAPWTLDLDQGDSSEEFYEFNVSISNLDTNLFKAATMIIPALNATNVATNTPFQWSGPAGFGNVFINTYKLPNFNSYGFANLPGNATNWPSPPALNYGTNGVTLVITSNNFPGVTTSIPTNGLAQPIFSWSSTSDLESLNESPFVVGQPAPLPVALSGSPSGGGGGNFQLSFQTLAGRPEIIQTRTNLISGSWVDVTNFIGDGSSYQLNYAISNSPGAYFRVISQ